MAMLYSMQYSDIVQYGGAVQHRGAVQHSDARPHSHAAQLYSAAMYNFHCCALYIAAMLHGMVMLRCRVMHSMASSYSTQRDDAACCTVGQCRAVYSVAYSVAYSAACGVALVY